MSFEGSPRRTPSEGPTVRRERDEWRPAGNYGDRRRSPGRYYSSASAFPADRYPDQRRDRDRRRSRSPRNIDRYQPDHRAARDEYRPRRDYDELPRRRRSSPERPDRNADRTIDRYVPDQTMWNLSNPLPDPMKLDIQVGFTWFAEWWRTERRIKEEKERRQAQTSGRPRPRVDPVADRESEKSRIQAAYDQYKEDLQKAQAQTFVRLHKDEDWFRERYIPEMRDAFRAKLADFRKGLYAQFEIDLAEGVFDDFTLEGIPKAETDGQGGVLEKEEGEATAVAEILQTGDLVASPGGDLRDPMASQPTLLLKTIAPTVSREKLEEFAKEILGTEVDGFRHLSLSDPNPTKKCHRMGWIILKEDPDEQEDDPMPDTELEEGEAQVAEERLSTAARALAKIDGKTIEDAERGNFTVHCGIHRPPDAPRKKALWDLFSAPERIRRDLELAVRITRKFDNELGDECFGVANIEKRVHHLQSERQLRPTGAAKWNKDLDTYTEGEDFMHLDDDEIDDEDLLVRKKKLDLLVEYLRRVYNFCFFCVFESDSVHELQRKCAGGHLRRPRASLITAAKQVAQASAAGEPFPLSKKSGGEQRAMDVDEGEVEGGSPEADRNKFSLDSKVIGQLQRGYNWVKTYEEKLLQLLEPENVDLTKIGGVSLDDGIETELKKVSVCGIFGIITDHCPVYETRGHQQVPMRCPQLYEAIQGTRLLAQAYHSPPSRVRKGCTPGYTARQQLRPGSLAHRS